MLLVILAVAVLASALAYSHVPQRMATRFDFAGRPINSTDKSEGVFIFPGLLAIVALAGLIAPPLMRRAGQAGEMNARLLVRLLLVQACLFLCLHVAMLLWSCGAAFPMPAIVLPLVVSDLIATFCVLSPAIKTDIASGKAAKSKLPPNIWFPAKTFGWGWGPPVRWQGWVVMGVWMAATLGGVFWMTRSSSPNAHVFFLVFVAVMVVLLVAICWIKGERPCWRWPGKSGPKAPQP